MATAATPIADDPVGLLGRLANNVCRRAFSSPEAVAYELTIAPALAEIVVPAIIPHVVGTRVLDVGCGGGRVAVGLANELSVTVVGLDPSPSQVHRLAQHAQATGAIAGVQDGCAAGTQGQDLRRSGPHPAVTEAGEPKRILNA
jgi:2-polyprenyl-3-methyl-5-hydroxy-6-metoxy-1,4-benzoquinol methylase